MQFLVVFMYFILVPLCTQATRVERKDEDQDRQLSRMNAFMMDLQDQINELKKMLTEDSAVIPNSIGAKQNDTEELEARVTVLEESVADLEVDVLALADDMDNVEAVNILQEETINTLEAEIFDNENDIEALVQDVDSLEDASSELQIQVLGLDLRVGNLEPLQGNVTDLGERVESLEVVTSDLVMNVSDIQDKNVQQDQAIAAVEDDVTGLDQRVENLESRRDNITERLEALEEETSQLSGDISELQTTTEDFEARIQELESVVILPWEACLSSPCENEATCLDVNLDTFVCMCRDGYFGVTCGDSYADATFLVALEESGVPDNPILFTWEVINPGGNYSTETGKYTVPYDGIYQFSANLQTAGNDGYIDFYIDDSNTGTHDDIYSADSSYRSVTLIQELTAGQTVHVYTLMDVLTGSSTQLHSYFSGHLVSVN